MAALLGVLWVVCVLPLSMSSTTSPLNDGLYVSNGTDILFVVSPESPSSELRSVYKQQEGRIVGLAYDRSNGYLFWSEMPIHLGSRGIYKGEFSSPGQMGNYSRIISEDILEVNGLTYDWISNHLYWTDSRKKTLEVSDPDGSNRKILFMSGLNQPRGIYADPINGYLFWTDQGHKHIARCQLDGSNRQVIVSDGVTLPNQLVVSENKLYWVDSDKKTFESSNLDGSSRGSATPLGAIAGNQHIFGLAIADQKAFVTNWINGQLITFGVNAKNPSRGAQNLGKENIFSAIYVNAANQRPGNNPCSGSSCGSLCLPNKSPSKFRCACPSYGAMMLRTDNRTCARPVNIVVYAVASSGYVCIRDQEAAETGSDVYVVGRSPRPVAVAYDPVRQQVFWSDVIERSVHTAKVDGSSHMRLLGSQHGIGLVEGMVVDVARRQLYYTNIGSVLLGDTPYSWHRVETIKLDPPSTKVKTLVTTADKPRGIVLDSQNGHLYYTDWGNRASVVRINLDGSNPTLIRTGLDNPNGITLLNNRIYFVDSHYKTRHKNEGLYPVDSKNGSLYSMNLDGSDLKDVMSGSNIKFQTPFGLAATKEGRLYVSDWETKVLTSFSLDGTQSPVSSSIVHSDLSDVMSIYISQISNNASTGASNCGSCGDLCLSKEARTSHCTCNSLGGKPLSGHTCSVPTNFLIFADMNSIKIVSLDGSDSNTYTAVQGSPYLSNFVGLTMDTSAQTVYYSDVNRKTIHSLNLANMTSKIFYRVNDVIDGLTFTNGKLYWSDYLNGKISYLDTTASELKHSTLIRNLKRPRGIKIHGENIYWTEWGESHRVAKRSLRPGGGSGSTILDKDLVWPNGIHIDSSTNRLHVVDGHTKKIYNCPLDGTGQCSEVPGVDSVLKHAYDIWVDNGVFYYSDWKTGAINAYRPEKPGKSWTIVGGLMRPTQMFIRRTTSASPTCPSGTCANGVCVPLIVNYGCDCGDKPTSPGNKTCEAAPSSCSNAGKTYKSGQEFKPIPCVQCQCVGRFPFAADPVYNDSLCQRLSCPKLNCPAEETELKPDACCRTCTKCSIRITDCPKQPVELTVPDDQNFVVYEYLPSVRDCQGLSREIGFVKKPEGTVYRPGNNLVLLTAYASQNHAERDSCTYTVRVQDKTPPTIKCPNNVIAYIGSHESSVPVRWNSPEAFDNVGLEGEPKPSRDWGSSFTAGDHTVTYTARDKSGHTSSCTFNVTVNKLKLTDNLAACEFPRIDNANLQCSTHGEQLFCSLNCDPGTKTARTQPLTCHGGQWTPVITDEIIHKSCKKTRSSTVSGKLEAIATKACSESPSVNYTSDSLYDRIRKNHLQGTNFDLKVTAECRGHDLVVTTELKAKYNDTFEGDARADLDEKLREIKEKFENGFLRVPLLTAAEELKVAQELAVSSPKVTSGCQPGEINSTKGNGESCEVCLRGTYQLENKCEQCLQDTYNDLVGQTNCKPCPDGGTTAINGSYIVDLCVARPTPDNTLQIIAIIAAVVLFLILFIVIIILVRSRRRSAYKHQLSKGGIHVNKTFDQEDCDETYDKIADEEETGLTPINQNHYERLETAPPGAAADSYDKIGDAPTYELDIEPTYPQYSDQQNSGNC